MFRKSFNCLSQKVLIHLLVLLFIATGCSNSTGSGGGSDSGGVKGSVDEGTQTVSASTVEKGIKVTVDVPEGCPILYFNRIKKGSEYRECWYCVENAKAGAYTAIDYFVEEDTTYTYSVDFYDTNWKFKETSKSIEATSSEKGFDLPATTNKAKATYNSDTKKLSFSTKPTFSYTKSPVDGYPTLKIELLYKCAENAYQCICEYPLGGTQTGEIYDYIFERYKGKTITFFCIRYKFKSADGKSSYEFDIGHDAEIQDITLPGSAVNPDVKKTIGISMPDSQSRWGKDGAQLEKQFEDAGYTVEISYGDDTLQKQITQLNALIAKNVDCLVIAPKEESNITDVLENAKAKDIPVISYDRLIKDSDAVTAYVTFDNEDVGKKQGQFLVDHRPSGTGIPLYLYTGAPSDGNATYFFSGAWSVLQPKISDGTFTVVNSSAANTYKNNNTLTASQISAIITETTTNWDWETAASKASSDLAAAGDSGKGHVCILAPNDGTARTIADVFRADSAVLSYVITGQDADADSLEYIFDGKQSMTVWKDPAELAKVTVELAKKIFKNQSLTSDITYDNNSIDIPAFLAEGSIITAANYATAVDLSTCTPSIDDMKGKIIYGEDGHWHDGGVDGYEYRILQFSTSVDANDSLKLPITEYKYQYHGERGNISAFENEYSFDDNSRKEESLYYKNGKICFGDNHNAPLYCVKGKYYISQDYDVPLINASGDFIGAVYSLTYSIDGGVMVTIKFSIIDSTTMTVEYTSGGNTAQEDCPYTYSEGICTIILPASLAGEEHKMQFIYTSNALVGVEESEEYDTLPDYPAPLITDY